MKIDSHNVSGRDVQIYSVNFAEFNARGEKSISFEKLIFFFVLAARKFSAKFWVQLHTLSFLGS